MGRKAGAKIADMCPCVHPHPLPGDQYSAGKMVTGVIKWI